MNRRALHSGLIGVLASVFLGCPGSVELTGLDEDFGAVRSAVRHDTVLLPEGAEPVTLSQYTVSNRAGLGVQIRATEDLSARMWNEFFYGLATLDYRQELCDLQADIMRAEARSHPAFLSESSRTLSVSFTSPDGPAFNNVVPSTEPPDGEYSIDEAGGYDDASNWGVWVQVTEVVTDIDIDDYVDAIRRDVIFCGIDEEFFDAHFAVYTLDRGSVSVHGEGTARSSLEIDGELVDAAGDDAGTISASVTASRVQTEASIDADHWP